MSEPQKGFLAIAACALLWSTAGIFIKVVTIHPLAIAGLRSLIGFITLFIFLKKPRFTFSFPQIAAAVCIAVTMLLFVASNKLTTAANAILLQYSAPIFVAFFGWLILSERPNANNWITLCVTIAGMVLFFFDSLKEFHLLGDILSILAGITFGLAFVFLRMQKSGSPLESFLIAHILVACVGLPFLASGPFPAVPELGALLWLGAIQVGAASILFSFAIKRISAIQSALIAVIEPIFNPVWVFIFTGETPGFWSIIGGVVIIGAVIASSVLAALKKN